MNILKQYFIYQRGHIGIRRGIWGTNNSVILDGNFQGGRMTFKGVSGPAPLSETLPRTFVFGPILPLRISPGSV